MSAGDIERKLGITVSAEDLASGKLAGVKREVQGIQTAAVTSGSAWGRFTGGIQAGSNRIKTAVSGAVSHAKSQFASLASSATSLLGIGGVLGGFALVGKSIEEASQFGANVQLVAGATRLALPTASAMVDTLDKWGVSSDRLIPMMGKLVKNVEVLGGSSKANAKFQKDFGISLQDSNGHLLDANQLLLKSADYFNGNATAGQKALFLSKLWGKNWQDMIPILSKGSDFIKSQEADSIHLTQQQLDNITKYRNAQREFQDSWGDTEVKIGSVIMPLITTAMTTVSGWLDAHGDEVATWFQNAAGVAGQIASTAISVVGAIQSGWNAIPEPLRNLIMTGLVADRAFKFVFGFSPAGLALKVGGDVIGGLAKAVGTSVAGAVLGNAINVQKVWVMNPGFGGGGGNPLVNAGEGAAAAEGVETAAGAGAGITAGGIISAVAGGLGIGALMVAAAEFVIATGKDPLNIGGRSSTAAARGLDPSRIDRNFSGPRSAVPSSQWGSSPSGAVNVVDNSPGARDERAAAKISATWNAATAAHTEALNSNLSAKTEGQIRTTERSNALLQAIAAKRESNRIDIVNRITVPVTTRVTVGGVNQAQTTYKQYQSGSASRYAL